MRAIKTLLASHIYISKEERKKQEKKKKESQISGGLRHGVKDFAIFFDTRGIER